MIRNERRREGRHSGRLAVSVFLSLGRNGPAASPVFKGQLITLSRRGAGIALAEVMAGQVHLAYGPMESEDLLFNVVFSVAGQADPFTIPARPVWLNKEQSAEIPPFRLGVEFLEPLPDDLFQQLKHRLG